MIEKISFSARFKRQHILRRKGRIYKHSAIKFISTLAPEVFIDFSLHERAMREPRSGEHESRSGEKEKPLVTLDWNLTFMQTPGSGSDPRPRIG